MSKTLPAPHIHVCTVRLCIIVLKHTILSFQFLLFPRGTDFYTYDGLKKKTQLIHQRYYYKTASELTSVRINCCVKIEVCVPGVLAACVFVL